MEKALRSLFILLTVSEANFRMLHWMAEGRKFREMHADADSFRSMVSDDIDAVAEMILRNTDEIPSLRIISNNLQTIIDTRGETIQYEKYLAYCNKILTGNLDAIEACLKTDEIANEIKNVGIKASLEAMYDKYDLQARYLMKRRSW